MYPISELIPFLRRGVSKDAPTRKWILRAEAIICYLAFTFFLEGNGQREMVGLDARGSERTHDYIFPELCAYYRANGRMFEVLSTLVQEKISARLSKIARSLAR